MRSGISLFTRFGIFCLCAGFTLMAAAADIDIPFQKFVLDNGLTLIVEFLKLQS